MVSSNKNESPLSDRSKVWLIHTVFHLLLGWQEPFTCRIYLNGPNRL
jgi:hypothetical protein